MEYSQLNMEDKQKLEHELNKIFTYLKRNYMFYYNNYGLRGFALRGFANLFDKTSECIYKEMVCLKKTAEDRLKYNAKIDDEVADTYANQTVRSMQEVKPLLDTAMKIETETEDCISDILKIAGHEDICLYKELMKLAHESQERRFRIDMIKNRLNLGGWDGHDIARVSKDIHKYLSSHDDLDFQLS